MEDPFRDTRLIVADLLHHVLRSGHSAFAELPFMEGVEVIVIVTAIYSAERRGETFTKRGLSIHLGMPRPTLLRRLAYLESKGLVQRDAEGLRINPQMFEAISDENIRGLREMIIDAGTALSAVET